MVAVFFAADTCYVPVYRSIDNSVPPVLGNPCSFEDCHSPPPNSSQSPVNPRLVGTAFAGPLSPAKVGACSVVSAAMNYCVHVCDLMFLLFRLRISENGGDPPAGHWTP